MHSLNHDRISSDQHVVLNDDRCGRSRFNDTRQHGSGADMAVFPDRSSSAKNGTHIDHGAFSDHRTDVDDSAHHNDGSVSDRNLLTNNGTRFDPGIDLFQIQHGDCAVAAIVLYDQIIDLFFIFFQDRRKILPVSEYDLVSNAKYFGYVTKIDRFFFFQVQFHRRFFLRFGDITDNFLCIHHGSFPLVL